MPHWMRHEFKKLSRPQKQGLELGCAVLAAVTVLLYLGVLLRSLRVLRRMDRALDCYIKEHTPPRPRREESPELPLR